MMVREFEDNNISKMIHALNIIKEIKLSEVTNDLDYRIEKIDSLGTVIVYLISFKRLWILLKSKNKNNNLIILLYSYLLCESI